MRALEGDGGGLYREESPQKRGSEGKVQEILLELL
jgi:hypothetical protein